jgi:hypothetical protein
MRYIAIVLLGHIADAVPSFDINLDLPPEQRWVSVANRYKNELIAMQAAMIPALDGRLGHSKQEFLQHSSFDTDYAAELRGIANAVKHPNVTVESLKAMNMLYEMQSPTYCAGVLWAQADGTVVHGRNMDYAFHFKMPDGHVLNWPDITFEATFMKGGKPLLKQVQWPGAIGLATAMRLGGWSFQQNTRTSANDWHENLAAAKQGGLLFGLAARRVMETTPDFKTAVNKIYATKFMAPMYFIISGTGPFEGVVLTVDRLGQHLPNTPAIQTVAKGAWHLVQTNDDLLGQAADQRRPLANSLLRITGQTEATTDNMMQFMHTTYLFNKLTVYSTVMVPATGFFKTSLPNEAPAAINGDQELAIGSEMWSEGGDESWASFLSLHRERHRTRQRRKKFLATNADESELSLMQLSVRLEN